MSERVLVEYPFGEGFEVFQVSVSSLEPITALDFGKLKAADTVEDVESEENGNQESAPSGPEECGLIITLLR